MAAIALWTGSLPRVSAGAAGEANAELVEAIAAPQASARPESNGARQARINLTRARSDGRAVLQPLAKLASSDSPEAGRWLNHLWQSTVYTLAVGLLAIAFRKNRARVRYWLWFSASVKFLIPLSLLMTLGSHLPGASAPQATTAISFRLEQVSRPFLEGGSSNLVPTLPQPGVAGWVGVAIFSVWACGFATIVRLRSRMWLRIRRTVETSVPFDVPSVVLPSGTHVREAADLMEPGVVGFWRPIILLPAGIEAHLTPPQLQTVLTHEICHIRFRDNVTAAWHIVAEAVFWFHPLVWWIGARLVDERERACDEEVLRICRQPRTYAEGILNVCQRYVDAQLACVSGVSGSDLGKRIEAILRDQPGQALSARRKLTLAIVGITTVAVPIVMGALSAPLLGAQTLAPAAEGPAFEVASVKPNKSRDARVALMSQPGGRLTATNVTATDLIRFAYELPDFRLSGGPDWLTSDRFDVVAKAEGDPPSAQKRLMLRRLLAERFKFTAHTETRVLPVYALVMARSDGKVGPRLRPADADCARTDQPSSDSGVGLSPTNGTPRCGYFGFAPGTDFPSGRGGLAFRGLTMTALAKTLVPMVGRTVIDQTGLTGYFDGEFDFIAELPLPPPPPGVPNPFGSDPFSSVFTVFPQQLGVKLDARRAAVEVLVIDRVEHPTEN